MSEPGNDNKTDWPCGDLLALHTGRMGEMLKSISSIIDGVKDSEVPKSVVQLLDAAMFMQREAVKELERLEDAIRGWAESCSENKNSTA